MIDEFCKQCHQPLHFVDVQRNDFDGTEADLMHCVNADCKDFERTRSYRQRPMPPEIRAARRAALERFVALDIAASLRR